MEEVQNVPRLSHLKRSRDPSWSIDTRPLKRRVCSPPPPSPSAPLSAALAPVVATPSPFSLREREKHEPPSPSPSPSSKYLSKSFNKPSISYVDSRNYYEFGF
eukprot:TRINITY_DN850_c0_g1_i2.p2 TRINITY_DN850_c0_g1~~TRINITY_DN850_c0_g1_i2.p2  ORF type:complete len:103 (-),score=19.80 TRINITY_DN850_c0_g1_i2:370-678(-)